MPDENTRSVTTGGDAKDSILTSGDHNVTLKDIIIKGTRNAINIVVTRTNPITGIVLSIILTTLMILLIHWGYNWYARNQILKHHFGIAHDFLKIGQYEKAKAAYQKVSEIDKENIKAAEGSEIISALEDLKDETKPMENIRLTADRLLGQSPENLFVHLLLGHLYAYDDAVKSRQHYEKAISLDSSFAEAYFSLGVLLQKQKKDREALENFEKAVRYSEFSPPYLTNLAYSYSKTGQYEKSLEIYEKILNNDKFYILVYCEIANVYHKLNNFREALNYLNHALDKLNNPKISDLPQNQGDWYFESDTDPVYVSGIFEKKYYVLQSLAANSERLGDLPKSQEYRSQARVLGIDDEKAHKIR